MQLICQSSTGQRPNGDPVCLISDGSPSFPSLGLVYQSKTLGLGAFPPPSPRTEDFCFYLFPPKKTVFAYPHGHVNHCIASPEAAGSSAHILTDVLCLYSPIHEFCVPR